MAGNIVEGNEAVTRDNWDGGVQFNKALDLEASGAIAKGALSDADQLKGIIARVRVDLLFPMAPVKIESAQAAFESVLKNVGATLPKRDSADERAVTETKTGKV